MLDESNDWASEQFGHAKLGDARRVARLVAMAAQAARAPAGKVTEVFESSADREGAFKFLENAQVSAERVAEAAFEATARACDGQRCVYVAVDGSSLTLTDRAKRRELGKVGKRWPTRGLHVMSALGVDDQGATIGLLAQKWWAQPEKPQGKKKPRQKCFGDRYLERETRYWLDAIEDVSQRLSENAPDARPWFQLDRGADCWPVLIKAVGQRLLFTVRSNHDRRLQDERGKRVYLRQKLKKQPILGHYQVEVPARPGRGARSARLALRACQVVIWARVASKKWRPIVINAVLAEEVDYRGKDRLRWTLLTTAPVASFEQARAVVHGYTLRWRVEEFHRAWKRGLCRVEETQLQSRSAIVKWATILASVAARALRLAQLVRTSPDIPARDEFTDYEITAAFVLAKRKLDRRRRLTLKDLTDIIADLGGFANKYSGGRPGPTVLGRGLEKVLVVAEALRNLDQMG
jgi:hypothetical protein